MALKYMILLLLYAVSWVQSLPITSTPLENNPDHLMWDELSVLDAKYIDLEEVRKIPKSIFITPNFNETKKICKKGYELGSDDKCYPVKDFKIDPLDIIKAQIESLFKPEADYEDYDYDTYEGTDSNANTQFQVPLSLSFADEQPTKSTKNATSSLTSSNQPFRGNESSNNAGISTEKIQFQSNSSTNSEQQQQQHQQQQQQQTNGSDKTTESPTTESEFTTSTITPIATTDVPIINEMLHESDILSTKSNATTSDTASLTTDQPLIIIVGGQNQSDYAVEKIEFSVDDDDATLTNTSESIELVTNIFNANNNNILTLDNSLLQSSNATIIDMDDRFEHRTNNTVPTALLMNENSNGELDNKYLNNIESSFNITNGTNDSMLQLESETNGNSTNFVHTTETYETYKNDHNNHNIEIISNSHRIHTAENNTNSTTSDQSDRIDQSHNKYNDTNAPSATMNATTSNPSGVIHANLRPSVVELKTDYPIDNVKKIPPKESNEKLKRKSHPKFVPKRNHTVDPISDAAFIDKTTSTMKVDDGLLLAHELNQDSIKTTDENNKFVYNQLETPLASVDELTFSALPYRKKLSLDKNSMSNTPFTQRTSLLEQLKGLSRSTTESTVKRRMPSKIIATTTKIPNNSHKRNHTKIMNNKSHQSIDEQLSNKPNEQTIRGKQTQPQPQPQPQQQQQQQQQQQHMHESKQQKHKFSWQSNQWGGHHNMEDNINARPVLMRFWNRMPLIQDTSAPKFAQQRSRENSRRPTDSLFAEVPITDLHKVLGARNHNHKK